jgi:uncharacterized alkaline shock family protein YloU
MRVLGIIFYATIIIFIGIALIIFSFHRLNPQDVSDFLFFAQNTLSSRLIVGLSGLLLILISFSFAQFILGRFQSEKHIAFATASGQVTIALSAVEDMIKRLAAIIPEIKELRPNVVATKKGAIIVDLKVVLRTEANIPGLTERLQEITKSKIQEVLGLEEQIAIRIHIAKIITHEDREKKRKDTETDGPKIPFTEYGRS